MSSKDSPTKKKQRHHTGSSDTYYEFIFQARTENSPEVGWPLH
jgi:hypothetical protein